MLRKAHLLQLTSSALRNFSRSKIGVIRQVDTSKLSRAEKVKNQNYETATLFGAKVKSKTKKNKDAVEMAEKKEEDVENRSKDTHGVNSEMYWIIEAKKSSQSSKSRVVKAKKKSTPVEPVEEKLSETFAKFKLDMPKPVKLSIQETLKSLNLHRSDQNESEQRPLKEIPFDQKQLRSIVDFPLILEQNDLMSDVFDKTQIMKRQVNFTPSVSKVLQATMSPSQKNILTQWKNLKIAELGPEGFEELQKGYLSRGKLYHECLHKYFNNAEITDDQLPANIRELWKSISPVLKEFEAPATVSEQAVFHPHLRYKGFVDCVSVHRKSRALSVIEWKNSDRHKKSVSSTFDAPLQMCAYLGALNVTQFQQSPLQSGIIVVAYNDGESADLFHLSSLEINKYWKMWLNRLQEYWIRYRDNTLTEEET